MHAEYCHAGIEAVEVLSSKEMDVVEVGGGKEERPRNCRVEDNCVCVKPSVSDIDCKLKATPRSREKVES